MSCNKSHHTILLCTGGVNLVGPFKMVSGGVNFIIIIVDYFSKWVEAKPLTKITSASLHKFVWENLICRLGILCGFTLDNNTQFDASTFHKFCIGLGINLCFNPKANGKVSSK